MDRLGATSTWTAAARAKESQRSDRLFFDPYAALLAGTEGSRRFAEIESVGNHSNYLAIRTRFFDDFALSAVPLVRQVVILAAGMDARAYRLSWPPGTTLFELDRGDVLAPKDELLRQTGAVASCVRKVVPADLGASWQPALLAAGFDATAPALFLVEGLTAYLSTRQVEALLAGLSGLAAPGARMGIDFVGRSFLEARSTRAFLSCLSDHDAPWLFGTDDPGDLLERFGWQATVTIPGEAQANWGRWPPCSRQAAAHPQSYLVRACRPPTVTAR